MSASALENSMVNENGSSMNTHSSTLLFVNEDLRPKGGQHWLWLLDLCHSYRDQHAFELAVQRHESSHLSQLYRILRTDVAHFLAMDDLNSTVSCKLSRRDLTGTGCPAFGRRETKSSLKRVIIQPLVKHAKHLLLTALSL